MQFNRPRLIVKNGIMPKIDTLASEGISLTVKDTVMPKLVPDKWGLCMAQDYCAGEPNNQYKSGWGRMDPSIRMDSGRGRRVCKTPDCHHAKRHCVSVTH